MIKAELVRKVARETGIRQADVAVVVDGVFETVSEELIQGGYIELRRFGTFHVVMRAKRLGINPATGKKVEFAAKKTPVFRVSKLLKERLNRS